MVRRTHVGCLVLFALIGACSSDSSTNDAGTEPDVSADVAEPDADVTEPDASADVAEPDATDGGSDTADTGVAAACMASGGTVSTALCCSSATPFPDTCAPGACGCAPGSSSELQVCDCGAGRCFDGASCVAP